MFAHRAESRLALIKTQEQSYEKERNRQEKGSNKITF